MTINDHKYQIQSTGMFDTLYVACTEWHDPTTYIWFNKISKKTKIELKSITQFSKPEAACPDKMLNVNIPRVGLDQCQAKVSSVNKIFVLWGDNTGCWCLDTITTMKTLNLFVTPAISSLICNIVLLSHNSYQFCGFRCLVSKVVPLTTSNGKMAMTIMDW